MQGCGQTAALRFTAEPEQVSLLTYDADGQRVRRTTVTDTIVYIGSHYEVRFEKQNIAQDLDYDCDVDVADIMLVAARWHTSEGDPEYDPAYDLDGDGDIDVADIMTVAAHWREKCTTVKYYTLGGQRVAMRKVPEGEPDTLYYLFSDHLGSSNVVYNTATQQADTIRYYPYGSTRSGGVPTDRLFTGQRFDGTIGLYDYGARFYDPALGRFVQADTIVPNPANPQDLNRYSYVRNNPLRYIDPTGYLTEEQIMTHFGAETWEEVLAFFGAGGELEGRWGWLEVLREIELRDKVQVLEGWSQEHRF